MMHRNLKQNSHFLKCGWIYAVLFFIFASQAQALPFFQGKTDPLASKWTELLATVVQTGYPFQGPQESAKIIVDSVPNNPRKNRVEYYFKVGIKNKKINGRFIPSGFVEARKATFTRNESYTNVWAVEEVHFELSPQGNLIAGEKKSTIFEERPNGQVVSLGEKTTPVEKSEAEKEWKVLLDYWLNPNRSVHEPRRYDPSRHILLDEA